MKTISKIILAVVMFPSISCVAHRPSMPGQKNANAQSISKANTNSSSINQPSETSGSKNENTKDSEKTSKQRANESLDFRY